MNFINIKVDLIKGKHTLIHYKDPKPIIFIHMALHNKHL